MVLELAHTTATAAAAVVQYGAIFLLKFEI